jgi:aminoglycoside 6'-N-acetyltransferase I
MTFASVVQLPGFAATTTTFVLEYGLVAELEDLFVVPTARHRGLSNRLIADSVVWAREQGCQRMELVVARGAGGRLS